MSNAQIDFRNDTYQYQFRTIGEDSPNLTDDPNWDIVNTDLLQYAATININGPDVLPPVEAASFILTSASTSLLGMRVWQASTDTLVNPLEVPTTSNPTELLRLLQNRIITPEDVLYFEFETAPESTEETYVYSYASWNAITQPENAPVFDVSIDLGGLS